MTDRERDVMMAESLIGKPNSYFKPIWNEFASGWDGAPCSEIACCISYMAGNLDIIPVSNYAQGLVDKFKKAGMFGHEPAVGAFVFFDYKDGNGFSHTGRVIAITGDYITTIEGNIGGVVVKRDYHKSTYYLGGYGYPGYAVEPTPEPTPTPTPTPTKQTFSDVPSTAKSYRAIEWAAKEGIVVGYSDGTFRPNENCTRQQVATMLWRYAGRPIV